MEYCSKGIKDSVQNFLTTTDVFEQKKMDALVSDLSLALDESQLPQYHRKRRGFKKRSKLISSLSLGISQTMLTDDSSSSGRELACSQDTKSSIPLTDSDEGSPEEETRMRNLHLTHHRPLINMIESDSVNENFSPVGPESRRKQKCKRLAFDSIIRPSTSVARPFDRAYRGSLRRKKQLRLSPDADRTIMISGGKRKRGGIDFDIGKKESANRKRCNHPYSTINLQSHDVLNHPVDEEMESECSDDSSEAELYTCDEGREADDEQSDFFAEAGPSYGIPDCGPNGIGNVDTDDTWWNPDNIDLSPSEKALFKARYEKMTKESQQACRLRFRKFKERLLRREMRAGKRRLQERKPGFGVVCTINDRVARFLRDPLLRELRLKPICERELDHLKHLADLYSFDVKTEGFQGAAPILIKTRKNIALRQLDFGFSCGLPTPQNDKKRCKTEHYSVVNNMTEGSNDSVESVIASGVNARPPVPLVLWEDVAEWEYVADSLSERLADSEPEPIPSPSSLGLDECTL